MFPFLEFHSFSFRCKVESNEENEIVSLVSLSNQYTLLNSSLPASNLERIEHSLVDVLRLLQIRVMGGVCLMEGFSLRALMHNIYKTFPVLRPMQNVGDICYYTAIKRINRAVKQCFANKTRHRGKSISFCPVYALNYDKLIYVTGNGKELMIFNFSQIDNYLQKISL